MVILLIENIENIEIYSRKARSAGGVRRVRGVRIVRSHIPVGGGSSRMRGCVGCAYWTETQKIKNPITVKIIKGLPNNARLYDFLNDP
jgi:hypothetical protein